MSPPTDLVLSSTVSAAHKSEPYAVTSLMPARDKGKGERVLASTMIPTTPYSGFAASGNYNRWRQVMLAYRGWYYLGTRARCEEIASHRPLAGFVNAGGAGKFTRHKFLDYYGAKSQHALAPHESIEPLGPDHPLEKLFDHPNDWDHGGISDILDEIEMFLCLTGEADLWVVPNDAGLPCELFVIPSQWMYGPFVDKNREDGLSYFECRPLIGTGVLRFPHEEIIQFKTKSPLHKLLPWSPTQAISEWIDSLDSVMTARFFMMKNGCFPMGAIELDSTYSYHDPDDDDLERLAAKFFAKFQGETRYGRPMVLPPGAKYNPLVVSPTEMAFESSSEQLRDWILAALGVPKEIAGLQDAGSEVAMYGPLKQFARRIRQRQRMLAAVLTRCLASRFDPHIRVWFPDPTEESSEEKRAKYQMLANLGWCTPNEGRSAFDLEPYEAGGDDPLLNSSLVPYPLNTGEDLSGLDDLQALPPGQQSQQDQGMGQDMGFGPDQQAMPADEDAGLIEKDARGTCKPGERSDLTNCTPASHEGAGGGQHQQASGNGNKTPAQASGDQTAANQQQASTAKTPDGKPKITAAQKAQLIADHVAKAETPDQEEAMSLWISGADSNTESYLEEPDPDVFWCDIINNSLRGQPLALQPGADKYVQWTIEQLDSTMQPTTTDLTVYRGAGLSALGISPGQDPTALAGTTFSDKGFMATSWHPGAATQYANDNSADGSAVVTIRAPKGTKAVQGSEEDREVVLARDTKMRITKVTKDEKQAGRWLIEAEVVQ